MPAGQMGWPGLFEEIRTKAKAGGSVHVYDAACGFGGITRELVTDETARGIRYVGADVHHSLDLIAEKVPALARCGMLLRWDMSNPLPTDERFDYIICRAAVHHTPDPRTTFAAFVARLKPGGQIAMTVYRKKGIAREALDDAFRNEIVPLDPEAATAVCRQFTVLGRALQQIDQKVTIPEDLPLFGIAAGEHPVQTLFYNHFLKCFFNPVFGEEYSTLVNYDWYHPRFAYRYRREEIEEWFAEEGLTVTKYSEIEAQMYFQGGR
jgi:SAM-dependent methyltransferase